MLETKEMFETKEKKKAFIMLEDGTAFEGVAFAGQGERTGEMVFNTGLTGYQEVLTDPSYRGQMVVMTAPQIGNYGINPAVSESARIYMDAFIIRENSRITSHWGSKQGLREFLSSQGCIGIEGVDTRALTLRLRQYGAMKAIISTIDGERKSLLEKVNKAPGLIGRDLVKEVTGKDTRFFQEIAEASSRNPYHVVVYDFGVKRNILRSLVDVGGKVSVVAAETKTEALLAMEPDGVLLSNGPGDPEGIPYVIEEIKKIIGRLPIMGICLGHQLIGLALGGRSFKLKFGHHGVNHPVKNLKTGRVEITVQNHGFCIDPESLAVEGLKVTHINLNDQTLEGIAVPSLNLMSVQFHPEASPGPHDAQNIFKDFVEMIKVWRRGGKE